MKEDRLKEVLLNYINSEKKLPWNKGFVDSYESGIVAGIGASRSLTTDSTGCLPQWR